MKRFFFMLIMLAVPAVLLAQGNDRSPSWCLAIHGGAGGLVTEKLSPETEKMYRDSLSFALKTGADILAGGGSSLDAVEAVIRFMEECPLFNAGRGAVYNADGIAELDASIMDGKTLLAGAVTGVTTIRHPISAARRVMEKTRHVLLMGAGAEEFAAGQGLEIVDPSFFRTKKSDEQYQRMLQKQQGGQPDKHGTVGCVALDVNGNLAAGTSTGGLMMKMKGRVGDSPIIGAGTYADNTTCAVSCTGTGEYFMRNVVAFDLSALMKYKGLSLEEAARSIIMEKLKEQGGSGGLIAIDRKGNVAMPFNTALMYRGTIRSGSSPEINVY